MHPIQTKVLHNKKISIFRIKGNPNTAAGTYWGTGIRSVMTTAIWKKMVYMITAEKSFRKYFRYAIGRAGLNTSRTVNNRPKDQNAIIEITSLSISVNSWTPSNIYLHNLTPSLHTIFPIPPSSHIPLPILVPPKRTLRFFWRLGRGGSNQKSPLQTKKSYSPPARQWPKSSEIWYRAIIIMPRKRETAIPRP